MPTFGNQHRASLPHMLCQGFILIFFMFTLWRGDGWLSWYSAPACYGSSLSSNPKHLSKIRHKQRSGQQSTHSIPPKKNCKCSHCDQLSLNPTFWFMPTVCLVWLYCKLASLLCPLSRFKCFFQSLHAHPWINGFGTLTLYSLYNLSALCLKYWIFEFSHHAFALKSPLCL